MEITIREQENEPYHGIVRLQYVPFETEEEFKQFWLPLRDTSGRVIREPLMSQREKDRYPVEIERHNCLTLLGKNLLLDFMGLFSNAPPFAAYLALGNGFCSGVTPDDTLTNNFPSEYFRKLITGYTKIGNQNALSVYLSSIDAVGNITHMGLVGGSTATSSFGTGTLSTHTLFPYPKGSLAATITYTLTQA